MAYSCSNYVCFNMWLHGYLVSLALIRDLLSLAPTNLKFCSVPYVYGSPCCSLAVSQRLHMLRCSQLGSASHLSSKQDTSLRTFLTLAELKEIASTQRGKDLHQGEKFPDGRHDLKRCLARGKMDEVPSVDLNWISACIPGKYGQNH